MTSDWASTGEPLDWELVSEEWAGDTTTWVHKKRPNLFSTDGGKTFYDVNEPWPDAGGPTTYHYNRYMENPDA